MTDVTTINSASLICTEGTSDKEYNVQLVKTFDGYLVNYQHGRRGNALKAGTKTSSAVALADAEKVFAKLVAAKLSDRYRHLTGSTEGTFSPAPDPAESYHSPQLLNEVSENEVVQLLDDPAFGLMPKMDGKRIMIEMIGDRFEVSNKLGKGCSVPHIVLDQIKSLCFDSRKIHSIHLDGELIGSDFYVFDILQLDNEDLKSMSFRAREPYYQYLISRAKMQGQIPNLFAVSATSTSLAKRALFERIKIEGGEGVVFKDWDAPYSVGRPPSNGPALKFKFKESSSCICLGNTAGGKRSIRLGMLDSAGVMVGVRNVTVPPNQVLPGAGTIVEVVYLYKFEEGCLFQPVLKGTRDDITRDECSLAQVKRLKSKLAESVSD